MINFPYSDLKTKRVYTHNVTRVTRAGNAVLEAAYDVNLSKKQVTQAAKLAQTRCDAFKSELFSLLTLVNGSNSIGSYSKYYIVTGTDVKVRVSDHVGPQSCTIDIVYGISNEGKDFIAGCVNGLPNDRKYNNCVKKYTPNTIINYIKSLV